ncbi:hypothetical protein BDR22DRAFT_976251 [Usnea florida]
MNADRRTHSSKQTDHTRQELIPLRDQSPRGRNIQTPLNEAKGASSDEEGPWRHKSGTQTWTAQSHSRGHSTVILAIAPSAKKQLIRDGVAGEAKKHRLALLLILLYAFVAIFSWTITCILCYRPIGVPTYFDQSGKYTRSLYETSDNWRKAASIGLSVLGVISIPVTSAICEKAATVYCQKNSDDEVPLLSLRQMLALADKGWSDSATLLDVVRPSTSRRIRSPLLILSTGLMAIAFIIPIIQTSIMGTEHLTVLSTEGLNSAPWLGYQVTPQSLIALYNSSIMDSVISSTLSGKLSDKQPYLWTLDQVSLTSVDASIFNSSSFNDIPKEQFIASFPVGTDTGVLRNLALRLNISVGCTLVPQSDFPSTCPGDYPLSQTFSNININVSNPNIPRYRARICAPGNVGYSPWKNTADRQDISEEFWLDYEDGGSNYTQHCYGNSTLGYFELPNYWNGHVAGPLLNTVPPNSPNLTYQNGNPSETTASPTPLHTEDVQDYSGTPGPFLTAIMAIFGPNTFFSTVAANSNWTSTYTTKALCSQLSYPFTCFAYYFAYNAIVGDFPLMNWLPNFGNEDSALAAFTLTTYAAANAILNNGNSSSLGYPIYSSPGTPMQKPTLPPAGIVIVSLLLAVQIIGLALLALYASRSATWTENLDAWAMLRVGAELAREDVPAVSSLKARRAGMLDEEMGWVGDMGVEGREGGAVVRELGIGGEAGVRGGGVLYRMERKKEGLK